MSKYLLDANVFIQAKNMHYGFDFCPAFWTWLKEKNQEGIVASVEKISDELHSGEDELTEWAGKCGSTFFLPVDEVVLPSLSVVSTWTYNQNYEPSAIATFLQVADFWLVAHAKAYDYTIVTHERPDNSAKKIKIPNACIGLQLNCITPYEMLRRERAKFILGRTAQAT